MDDARRSRAAWSHKTCRVEWAAASACSIARTGVAPIPALSSTTGRSPDCRMKLPRGETDVESIAHPDMLPQVGSSRTIRLDLHADSIALRREGARERIAAKKRRAAGGRLKTQDHVLAWQRHRQRLTVRALHRQRENVRGLVIDRRHRERPKSRRSRMRRRCRREPCVTTSDGSRLCSNASNDERHPGESASIRNARSSRSRG